MKKLLLMMLMIVVISMFAEAAASSRKEGVDIFRQVFDTCYDRTVGFLMLIMASYLFGYRIHLVKKA